MLSDANRFFASQHIAGFAPSQYTENLDSQWASTCGALQSEPGIGPDPEEALDVESVHIAAPDAKVVMVGADCDPSGFGESPLALQGYLDAATRVVDRHLADVVSNSWDSPVFTYSPADVAAWNLVFQQGALEGIGFDYPWGDNVTQANGSGTGYAPPPPGTFQAGSGGGLTALFAQPGYQASVVPAALATDDGKVRARRVVPDISANAGSNILIGYTGAVTSGVYGEVLCGGTSAATPLIAGLEADAMQAAGHPLGFANPALYRLYRTPAIHDVPAVSAQHPPVLFGQSIYSDGDNNLTTIGEDQPPLQSTTGYDDVTGLGAATASFVTAFPKRS